MYALRNLRSTVQAPFARLLRAAPTAAAGALFVLLALAARPGLHAAEAIPNGQGVLWKIDGAKAGVAPSYLFGTIHITDERVLDLPAPVRKAFAAAANATFEIIMTDDVRAMMGRAMVLDDGRTLDGILSPELFAGTLEAGRRYGLTENQVRRLKPWALATVFSIPQAELARGAAGTLPLDQWLQAEAQRTGKALHALETPQEQIDLFNGMAEPDQIDMLAAAVSDNAAIEAMFDDLTNAYLARDVAAIFDSMTTQTSAAGARFMELFLRRFNDARNKTMARRMEPILSEGGAFVAVGALHLPGEGGLVSLLRARGYRVTRAY